MPLPLQKFREILFLLLYSSDFAECSEEDSIFLVMRELSVSKKYVLEACVQKRCIMEKIDTIDDLIRGASSAYELHRIPHIERNILRLGVYELFYREGLTAKIVIAEALRLAHKFASPESTSFVNAILDTIYRGKEKNGERSVACSVRAE